MLTLSTDATSCRTEGFHHRSHGIPQFRTLATTFTGDLPLAGGGISGVVEGIHELADEWQRLADERERLTDQGKGFLDQGQIVLNYLWLLYMEIDLNGLWVNVYRPVCASRSLYFLVRGEGILQGGKGCAKYFRHYSSRPLLTFCLFHRLCWPVGSAGPQLLSRYRRASVGHRSRPSLRTLLGQEEAE